jgi:hypothetical protein
MPWHIARNVGGCSGYAVVKDGDNEVVGCHPSEKDAKAQLAALYASEAQKNVNSKPLWDGFFLPETD